MSLTTKQQLESTHAVACEQQGEIVKLTKECADLKAKLAERQKPFVCFDYGTDGPILICPNCTEDRFKAKLAQVEADAAAMREAVKKVVTAITSQELRVAEYEANKLLESTSGGQALLDELAKSQDALEWLRAERSRLLKAIEEAASAPGKDWLEEQIKLAAALKGETK